MKKQTENTNQLGFDFNATVEEDKLDNPTQSLNVAENDDTITTLTTHKDKPVLKKIDDYVPEDSPLNAEGQALKSLFDQVIKEKVSEETTKIFTATQDQEIPETFRKASGYELSFDYDEDDSTATLDKRLVAVIKPMGGTLINTSIFGGSVSTSVFLPVTLEVATSFFDKFLKVQFSRDIKMSGTISREDLVLTAIGSKEDLKAIKSDWKQFAGVKKRELVEGETYLNLIFASQEDFVKNSAALAVSGTEVNGVKFVTEFNRTILQESKNYNPHRAITPD